ncbi:MAG: hypothetical protein H0U42_02500 [Thermoleophilaceae bacterium]|nr:hypothetical protein [Thermoleophilaceae bacterium]
MDPKLEELVTSLLYEGYALYPYTPAATKNATPTPFGIVYPPAYATDSDATFDHLRIDCYVDAPEDAPLSGEVRFLQAAGDRHQAVPRRIDVDEPGTQEFDFGEVQGRIRLRRDGDRVRMCVHNLTPFDVPDADRATALGSALLSTHVVVRLGDGRFISPLEAPGENVNSFPVLASDDDRAILGAAIVLPDHPQLAPQSKGGLFDSTEIEEALLLHVQTLSDGELEAIEDQDPAVREMIARAAAATPEDIFKLHAVMTPSPEPMNMPGEHEIEIGGRTFQKGGKVILRLGTGGDPHDMMLNGRSATIERIYVDVEEGVHLAVTIDDDPGADVMRSSGRYMFFKPQEVELRP